MVAAAVAELLRLMSVGSAAAEVALLLGPIWAAALLGLVVGWAWKPRWAGSMSLWGKSEVGSSQLADGRALGRSRPSSVGFGSIPGFGSIKAQLPGFVSVEPRDEGEGLDPQPPSLVNEEKEEVVVTVEDFNYLSQLVEVTDGGPSWIPMMNRSTASMSYQAWRRDPETGPPQYRSRTVYDDATPEQVRDFFWDDEFRAKWDGMHLYSKTLESCPSTGTMVVHWVRKFPFFCSDREYIIGRRIWESDGAYYCVTKGVPHSSIPRCNKPRRVDLYYSSWCIGAVKSRKGDGQVTACEVILFHYEDMGIPREIAKLGIRQGMWGVVKVIEPGLRAYQLARKSGTPLSPSASMAQITSKISQDYLHSVETTNGELSMDEAKEDKHWGSKIPRLIIIGGAVVLACSLDRGLLTKALIFGVARKLGVFGRRV